MEKITRSRRAPFGSNPNVGEAGRATQQRILEAASAVFAEAGYARTSVEAITDRAGCSRPTFYQYFSNKEDLHRHLAGRLGAELSRVIQRLDGVTADAVGRAKLFVWLEELTHVYARYREVANTFSTSVRTDDRMVSGAADLSAEYGQSLVRGLNPGTVDPGGLKALAEAANITAFGACIYRDRIGEVTNERLAEALADTLHRTFFGPLPGVNLGERITPSPSTIERPEPEPPGDGTEGLRARGAETRQRLLDAAVTAYGTLGFDAVRVDDIAAESGMSHGTFYRYFRNKESIFDEHADRATVEIGALLAELPIAHGSEHRWARSYYEHYERLGGIISCLRDARSAGVAGATRARHDMSVALAAALDQRGFGDVDADIVICFSLLEDVPAAAFGYSGLTVEEATDATATILARGVFGYELTR